MYHDMPKTSAMSCSFWHRPLLFAGIESAPATLESTCFALAHGLDLHLTRVQPSKTFDLLPEDFPFALLIAIVVAMIAGSAVLQYLSSQTSLKQKWA